MFVVMTKVKLKPDSIDRVLDLFKETNPDLVEGQDDWLEAKFTANYDKDEVTVLAFWQDDQSYREFSTNEKFQQVMSKFSPYFQSQPEITINRVLFDM